MAAALLPADPCPVRPTPRPLRKAQHPIDRISNWVRSAAIALGFLVCATSTGLYFVHPDAPGSVEWWQLGMLIGFEIALVTAGSTLVVSCVAHRALDRRARSRRSQPPLGSRETGEAERSWGAGT